MLDLDKDAWPDEHLLITFSTKTRCEKIGWM